MHISVSEFVIHYAEGHQAIQPCMELHEYINIQFSATSSYHNPIITISWWNQCTDQYSTRPLTIIEVGQCVNFCPLWYPAKIIIMLKIYIYFFSLAFFSHVHTCSLATNTLHSCLLPQWGPALSLYIYMVPYIHNLEYTQKILWTRLKKRKCLSWKTHHGYARFVNDEEKSCRF